MSENVKSEENFKIDDEFLKSQSQTVFNGMKSARFWVDDRRKKDLDLYEGQFSDQEKQWSELLGTNRLFINKTYTYTQRILVDIIDAFYSDPDELVAIGSDKSVPYWKKDAVKALLNYRLNSHPIDFYKELYESGLDAIRNMTTVLKVYPMLKTKKVPKKVEISDGTASYIVDHPTETEEEIEAYSPRLDTLPPEDVFFSDRATWKDYHQFPICHRYVRTRDQLKRMGYKNVDAVSVDGDKTLGDMTKTERYKDQSPFSPQNQIPQQKDVVVYEMWDHLPGEDGLLESGSYIMLGDARGPMVVGRSWEVNELPYKLDDFEYNRPPFILGVAYPESHKLEGKSYPWITESLQKETNAQRNQEREAVARALRPHVYVNRDANVDLMALVNRRIGNYVQGDLPAGEAITELPTMNPMAITSAHQARTDNDYSETGIPPNLNGAAQGDDTATEATQRLSNANKKITFVLKNLAYTAYVSAFRLLLRLEQTYCTDEFVNMVTGKMLGWQFANDQFPARNAIQGDFDLKVNLGIGKMAQTNKMLMIWDRMNQTNQANAQLVQLGVADPSSVEFYNPSSVCDMILTINGHRDLDSFKYPAKAPSVAPGEGQGAPSMPSNPQDPSMQVSQMSPEATGLLNVA